MAVGFAQTKKAVDKVHLKKRPLIMGVYFLPFLVLTHRLVTNGTSTFRGLYSKMALTPIGLIFEKKNIDTIKLVVKF